MRIMVISSVERFIDILPKLEDLRVSNIYFYNAKTNKDLNVPVITLIPFVDVVVVGKDAHCFHINRIIEEAKDRHVPVINEGFFSSQIMKSF